MRADLNDCSRLGVHLVGGGEGSGFRRAMERGEEGARRQRIRFRAPQRLFLLAGWIRLDLAVILVYGRPLDLYWRENSGPRSNGAKTLGHYFLVRLYLLA